MAQEQVEIDGVLWNTPGYLGIFETHAVLGSYEIAKATAYLRILKLLREPLAQKIPIAIGIEDARKHQKRHREILDKFLLRPEKDLPGFSKANLLAIMRTAAVNSPSQSYVLLLHELYFQLRDNTDRLVSAFSERGYALPGQAESPHDIMYQSLLDGQTEEEVKYKHTVNFLISMIMRDFIFAGQILKKRAETKNSHIVTIRGTAHIGLIPILQLLTADAFPNIDVSEPKSLYLDDVLALFLPILWNKELLSAIIDEVHITKNATLMDARMAKVPQSIAGILRQEPLNTYIREGIAQKLSTADRLRVISQEIPAHSTS